MLGVLPIGEVTFTIMQSQRTMTTTVAEAGIRNVLDGRVGITKRLSTHTEHLAARRKIGRHVAYGNGRQRPNFAEWCCSLMP